MCLVKITKKYRKNDDLVVAYKVFIKDIGIRGQFYGGPYKVGEIYKSGNLRIDTYGGSYETGFHCYKNLNDAIKQADGLRNKSVFEVHLWDIRVEGFQWNSEIIVGKNIRIIRQLKKKGNNYGG